MTPGYTRPLYILACDHRTSFRTKLFGLHRPPTHQDRRRMAEAKLIVLEGLAAVADTGRVDAGSLGALFDEQYGAQAAHQTREKGLKLAICAERSSQPEFEFAYGDDFGKHITAFAPDFVKILARYNPAGDRELNRRQAARLARLSEWLASRPVKFLFELIVPPEGAQLLRVDERARFEVELRPKLAAAAITELQRAGVEPDLWKVEGLDSVADCTLIADAARSGGRDWVGCIVLGAGADCATVTHWLQQAACVDGFVGFAIGRTIFWDALSGWITGAIDREAAVRSIADNYASMIDVYSHARATR
jgi:myo-inositol catabolism protein IolC